jgi:hypothetical protein
VEHVDPRRVGVIAVDDWNHHWCKSATMRVDAMVPRIDRALNAARELGMTVVLCPSDVVDNYVGYPSAKRSLPGPLLLCLRRATPGTFSKKALDLVSGDGNNLVNRNSRQWSLTRYTTRTHGGGKRRSAFDSAAPAKALLPTARHRGTLSLHGPSF